MRPALPGQARSSLHLADFVMTVHLLLRCPSTLAHIFNPLLGGGASRERAAFDLAGAKPMHREHGAARSRVRHGASLLAPGAALARGAPTASVSPASEGAETALCPRPDLRLREYHARRLRHRMRPARPRRPPDRPRLDRAAAGTPRERRLQRKQHRPRSLSCRRDNLAAPPPRCA